MLPNQSNLPPNYQRFYSILFLDIDGVMNSGRYVQKMGELFDDPAYQMDPIAVGLINLFYEATGAPIVVTSTWRKPFLGQLDKLQECMASYKIRAPIIGMTPDLAFGDNSRSQEIKTWISEHTEVRSFAILDDGFLPEFPRQLVQTTYKDGLQKKHVKRCIELLGPICACSCRSCYAGPFPCHCEYEVQEGLEVWSPRVKLRAR